MAAVEVVEKSAVDTPRLFHSYPGASYILPADDKEVERLRLQHRMLRAAFEDRVLLVPLEPQSSYFVLDSGAGPAAWLLDAAAQLPPTSILHGIDIESRNFPRTRPANVSFSVTSITALPDAWAGRFDIVHQRLLKAALRRAEWPQAISEIARALRPGGWAQLCELASWTSGPITARHRRLHDAIFAARGLYIDVTYDLPETLSAAGLVDVRVETRAVPLGAWAGPPGVDLRDDLSGVYRAMKTAVFNSGGLGFFEKEEEFDRFMDDMEKEWDTTEGGEAVFHVVCARKPFE
ncbi:hypothetical protein M0805_008614 [Coniferiporia weirii]|nr:hypothetical protein M0805_008614 [Coniferiporia weirii]